MGDKERKRLKSIIMGRGSKGVFKYKTELGTVYFIPKEIDGNIVKGYMITPKVTLPSNSISLDELLEKNDLYISNFEEVGEMLKHKK